MNSDQLAAALAFNCIHRLNFPVLASILELFGGDLVAAWRSPDQWRQARNMSADLLRRLLEQRDNLDPERLYGEYLASGASVTCYWDDDYPASLKTIYDPPPLLFYRGRLPIPGRLCLAMVGSRRASAYGRQAAELLSRDLAYQGAIIVSGLARGIDGYCHQAALDAGGDTIAVLGSGVDVIYPPEHDRLYARICSQGGVLSEFPLGTPALPINFPRRNRVISGLCSAVIVIEAGNNSGTLHTADFALEQQRDVFAVPGSIFSSTSRGTNRLLQAGAKPALSAEDIWREYSDQPLRSHPAAVAPSKKGLADHEKQLLEALRLPKRPDQLDAAAFGLDAGSLAAALTMLELQGWIRRLPDQHYQTVIRSLK